jgi:hypothetical protein
VKIDEGKTFEDVYELIDFSHPEASAQIDPGKEYKAYTNGKQTLIEEATKTSRIFKPKDITYYGGSQ